MLFRSNLLSAASSLAAARIARRIGLINTMVFTHLPSNVLLILVPLMPNLELAILCLLLRFSVSQMDVPTRQSYVAAVVQPHERTYASGITNLARTISWAAASSLAGALMEKFAFSAPLVLGGSLKITYDLLLYRGFDWPSWFALVVALVAASGQTFVLSRFWAFRRPSA